ncbi:MAG TPA: adenylate/guanylate cyclase domain-containing protein [Anaerolineales bacterium]
MVSNDSSNVTLHGQTSTLALRAALLRDALEREKPGTLPPNTVRDLSSLADMLGRIGHKLEAFEAEHRNMQALAETGGVVNSSLELDEVLRIVMDNIVRLTHAERGFLVLRDARGQMVTQVARNWEKESIKSTEAATSRTIVQRVIETGEAVITTNAQEDQRFSGTESIVALNLRSILCVPLKVKNELIGVIYTDNRIRAGIFTEAERDLLVAFSNQAAVAIENARLFTSLRQTLEEVTGLKNLMDNVFASIASGVITADVENQILLCNRAAEAILGRTMPDILGHRLQEVLASAAAGIEPHLAEVREKDTAVVGLEISYVDPVRGQMDWRLNLAPLRDSAQKTQGIAIVLDDLTERKKLEAQRRLLERMVSPAILDQIDLKSLQIGGKQVNVTAFFADVRGFTAFSEKHTPEELVTILNRYLAAAADAVLDNEGTVDKFLGDAVMAWFNAPVPQPDHSLRAVKSALALRRTIEKLHRELPPEAHLDFGVGIHYGDAVLGWIGTEKRLEFTAIGDSINTAKRLQENAGKNQILLSRPVYERVMDQVDARPCPPMSVKGKAQPLEVYEVMGLKS